MSANRGRDSAELVRLKIGWSPERLGRSKGCVLPTQSVTVCALAAFSPGRAFSWAGSALYAAT